MFRRLALSLSLFVTLPPALLCHAVSRSLAQTSVVAHSEPHFEVVVSKNLGVAMRDGTRLAADLYLPARSGQPVPGKHPTLLARTPYDKNGMAAEARWFAARGYAVVLNDVRGRFSSEGQWRMLLDDPADGYDLLT